MKMRAIKILILVILLTSSAQCSFAKKDDNGNNNNKDRSSSSSNDAPVETPAPVTTPVPATTTSQPTTAAASPTPKKEELCRTHTVQDGDSALSISQKYGLDYDQVVSALSQCVGYVEGTFLNVGQSVCLPPYYSSCTYVVRADPTKDECKLYTVQPGDTITSVASSFNVELEWITELNGDTLTPGKQIKLPPWYSRCPNVDAANNPPCRVYSVKEGEALYNIATGFRTSVDELIAANPGLNPSSVLSAGQPVKIPPFTADCGAGTVVTSYPTAGVSTCRTYKVQAGDSIYSIAVAFGSSGADMLALNPELSEPSMLANGNVIKIPPWDDTCPQDGVLVDKPSANPPVTVTSPTPSSSGSSSSGSSSTTKAPPTSTTPSSTAATVPAAAPRQAVPVSTGTTTTPATSAPAPNPRSKLDMVVGGTTKDAFAVKQQGVVAALSLATGVPTSDISVTSVVDVKVAARRRSRYLLGSSGPINGAKVQCTIAGDSKEIEKNLQYAQSTGELTESFDALGLTLESMVMYDPMGMMSTIVATDATLVTESTGSGGSSPEDDSSSLPMPIIIGAAAGGAVLVIAFTWLYCCLSKRKQRRKLEQAKLSTSGSSKPYPGGVNAYVTASSFRKGDSKGDFADYNKGVVYATQQDSRNQSFSSTAARGNTQRQPSSNMGSRNSSQAANMSDAYITTTVSTPRLNQDQFTVNIPSDPPSATTSSAETLVEEAQGQSLPRTGAGTMTALERQHTYTVNPAAAAMPAVVSASPPRVPVVIEMPPEDEDDLSLTTNVPPYMPIEERLRRDNPAYTRPRPAAAVGATRPSGAPPPAAAAAAAGRRPSPYGRSMSSTATASMPIRQPTSTTTGVTGVNPSSSSRSFTARSPPGYTSGTATTSRAAGVSPARAAAAAALASEVPRKPSFGAAAATAGSLSRRTAAPTASASRGDYVSPYAQRSPTRQQLRSPQGSVGKAASSSGWANALSPAPTEEVTSTTSGSPSKPGYKSPAGAYVSPYSQKNLRTSSSAQRQSTNRKLSTYAEF